MYYLIDPTFKKVSRLFVLSFKNSANDLTRDSFDKYYLSLKKSKDFNALIDNKPFLSTLKKQTNASLPQQMKFTGKLHEDDGATMFFIPKKQQKTILNFSLASLIVTEKYKQ